MARAVRQFEKEVSFRLETGVGYVTSNCMGRAVRQFEKEVSFRLRTRLENVTSNCIGRAVHQFLSLRTERKNFYTAISLLLRFEVALTSVQCLRGYE